MEVMVIYVWQCMVVYIYSYTGFRLLHLDCTVTQSCALILPTLYVILVPMSTLFSNKILYVYIIMHYLSYFLQPRMDTLHFPACRMDGMLFTWL